MKNPLFRYLSAAVMTVLVFSAASFAVRAQEAAPPAESAPVAAQPEDAAAAAPLLDPEGNPMQPEVADVPPPPVDYSKPFRDTLVYSPAEITAIMRAMEGSTLGSSAILGGSSQEAVPEIPLDRKIRLSGVYYKNPQDWIIWINGYKNTPNYLLPEIVDIKVYRDQVQLKWFDIGLNDVINITLRPHQVYDIVTGVLLPG